MSPAKRPESEMPSSFTAGGGIGQQRQSSAAAAAEYSGKINTEPSAAKVAASNMVNIFSRVEASDIESKETISLTPAQVSQTKMIVKNRSHKRSTASNKMELKVSTIDNVRTENSKMDDSDVLIEERQRHLKTETVTPVDAPAPMIN